MPIYKKEIWVSRHYADFCELYIESNSEADAEVRFDQSTDEGEFFEYLHKIKTKQYMFDYDYEVEDEIQPVTSVPPGAEIMR